MPVAVRRSFQVLDFFFSAVADEHARLDVSVLVADPRDVEELVEAFDDFADDDGLVVEVAEVSEGDEEPGADPVLVCRRHGDEASLVENASGFLEHGLPVDRRQTAALCTAGLDELVGDRPGHAGVLVGQRRAVLLGFSSAELSEVFAGFRHEVFVELGQSKATLILTLWSEPSRRKLRKTDGTSFFL